VYVDLPPRLFDFISINGFAATTESGIPPLDSVIVLVEGAVGGFVVIESYTASVLVLGVGVLVASVDDDDGGGGTIGGLSFASSLGIKHSVSSPIVLLLFPITHAGTN